MATESSRSRTASSSWANAPRASKMCSIIVALPAATAASRSGAADAATRRTCSRRSRAFRGNVLMLMDIHPCTIPANGPNFRRHSRACRRDVARADGDGAALLDRAFSAVAIFVRDAGRRAVSARRGIACEVSRLGGAVPTAGAVRRLHVADAADGDSALGRARRAVRRTGRGPAAARDAAALAGCEFASTKAVRAGAGPRVAARGIARDDAQRREDESCVHGNEHKRKSHEPFSSAVVL